MAQRNLRQKPRICYYEPEEPALDEYVFCEKCGDYVYEYCSLHGPLLVIPDDKVPAKPNVPSYVPRAALTIPHVFLHITYSIIPGAGLGVFSSMTLPSGVRFGPYRGQRTNVIDSSYCWQIYDNNRKPVHCIDAADANKSNWMRYVNCARHSREQNLVAYQYQGELYYRTIKIIPRFTELMVFYGSEFACELDVDLGKYNSPAGYAQKFGAPVAKKLKSSENSTITEDSKTSNAIEKTATSEPTRDQVTELDSITTDVASDNIGSQVNLPSAGQAESTSNCLSIKDVTKPNKTKKPRASATTKYAKSKESVTKSIKAKTAQINKNAPKLSTVNIETQEYLNKNKTKEVKTSTEPKNACIKDLYIYCDDCKKRCVSKQELLKHLRFHDGNRAFTCEICNKAFTKNAELKIHMRTHTGEKPYACEICNKAFTQSSDLKKHIRTHTGERPYACEICKKAFTDSSHFKLHMRTHTGEKPYACEICNKAFTQTSHFKKHMRTHTGEKPYACEICNKAFTQTSHFKLHMRTHTGEKPYACEICNKAFTQTSHFKKHMRTHTGEKPYACEICNKAFTTSSYLKIHLTTHTGEKPYACEICNKAFTTSSYLKIHLTTHTGEKPYACEICNKAFTTSSYLKIHLTTHTGEKPYACEICNRAFTIRTSLKRHLEIHLR